ncbi:hypothetical protein ZIOFF_000983 [Zingiber officinale]|uniref:Pentatricopeptide repeat-containing protein n=1 Tax=Zingiber officinale TaxID=94328 RepID=A0A8J5M878_ZINOF|nr:hypothetical protein ZIOFF_000983 [Zingiber officinale]
MASLTLPPASSLRPDLSSTSPLFPFLRPLTGDLRQSIHRKKFLVPADEATVSRLVQHKRDAVASLNLKLIVSGSTSLAMLFDFILCYHPLPSSNNLGWTINLWQCCTRGWDAPMRPVQEVVCEARGPRPRFPRVWKTRKRIGTISKSQKLVGCIKGLSNVKEEVYGALDSFVAWELEFPLVLVKKALKTLEFEKEWKRIIQVIKWMFSKGQGKTMGTYYTLLNALAEDGRLEEAEELWMKIFNENLENLPRIFFMKMITLYYRKGMHEKMFEVFADMEELGIRPDQSIVSMLGDVFQKLGMVDKYDKLNKKYPPPTWEYRYFKGKRVRIPISWKHMAKEVTHLSSIISLLTFLHHKLVDAGSSRAWRWAPQSAKVIKRQSVPSRTTSGRSDEKAAP